MQVRVLLLIGIILILSVVNVFIGSVSIPANEVLSILLGHGEDQGPAEFIIIGSRLPQVITAILAGSGLATAGLLLQTAFRNPLAGPSILGINSGASLGVAFVVLVGGSSVSAAGYSWSGQMAVMTGAFAGSLVIMALLLLFSVWLKNDLMLLIVGIMIGYLASSLITLLNYMSTAEGIHGYTMWGMGNFNGVSLSDLPLFAALTVVGLVLAMLMVKSLNIIMLGENYARNLGVRMQRVRNLLLITTGILTSVITAYCGPVSFIGLAVPHIARMIFRTADNRILLPGCMLTGAAVALTCNLICVLPSRILLPLNGVTPLIGVPVILYVIMKGRPRRGR